MSRLLPDDVMVSSSYNDVLVLRLLRHFENVQSRTRISKYTFNIGADKLDNMWILLQVSMASSAMIQCSLYSGKAICSTSILTQLAFQNQAQLPLDKQKMICNCRSSINEFLCSFEEGTGIGTPEDKVLAS